MYFECIKLNLGPITLLCLMLERKKLEYKTTEKIVGTYINSCGSDNEDIARQVTLLRGASYSTARVTSLLRTFSFCFI